MQHLSRFASATVCALARGTACPRMLWGLFLCIPFPVWGRGVSCASFDDPWTEQSRTSLLLPPTASELPHQTAFNPGEPPFSYALIPFPPQRAVGAQDARMRGCRRAMLGRAARVQRNLGVRAAGPPGKPAAIVLPARLHRRVCTVCLPLVRPLPVSARCSDRLQGSPTPTLSAMLGDLFWPTTMGSFPTFFWIDIGGLRDHTWGCLSPRCHPNQPPGIVRARSKIRSPNIAPRVGVGVP